MERQSHNEIDGNLSLIQIFLEEYSAPLNYDGRQFYSQLLKFLNDYKRKFLSNTSPFYNTIKSVIQKPPVFSLLSFSDCVESLNAATGKCTVSNIEPKVLLLKFVTFV